jgi:hypothetical protein
MIAPTGGTSWLDAYFWAWIAALAVLDALVWRWAGRMRWS